MAIVDDTPGTTRDRLFGDAEWIAREFTVIDTGGIDPTHGGRTPLSIGSVDFIEDIRLQAQAAIQEADAILFVVDVETGVTEPDREVADILRPWLTGGLEMLIKNGFKVNGLFTTKGVEKYLRQYVLIENDFASLDPELYNVATQLNHSRKVIFGNFQENLQTPSTKQVNYASISEAVAPSTSLPPICSPYNLPNLKGEERYYYDGEIRQTLSAHIAADQGCDLVISSFSMQPYHYTDKIGSLHKYGIPVILNQALYQVLEQKTHKHIECQNTLRHIHKTIDSYFKTHNLPDEDRVKLLETFNQRFNHNSETDYIHITPLPQNYEMFMVDHFSLNPKILERIVRIGFKSGINALRKHI